MSNYSTKYPISLPICIFHSESLKSLTINMHSLMNLKFPSALRFSNLQSLPLKYIWLVDECFGESISCCKFLRELWLKNVYGIENLTIENSSSLDRFSILYSYYPTQSSVIFICRVRRLTK